jgi:N-sulfoglucosamine sulfohydrolase
MSFESNKFIHIYYTMMNKTIHISLSGFLLIAGFSGCQQPSQNQHEKNPVDLQKIRFDFKPNILWISTEDISPYLEMYGDSTIKTPNLERLANEGILFENCFATTGQCAPSRHSIITGMHSTSTSGSNMRTGGKQFPDSIKCFPLYLDEAGYYCTNNFKTDYNFSEPSHASLWDKLSKTAHWKNKPAGSPFFAVFNRHETHESHINQDKPLRVDPDNVKIPPYYPDTKKVRRDIARNYSNIIELDSIVGDYMAEIEQRAS